MFETIYVQDRHIKYIFIYVQVHVQFRGHRIYKENEGINQELSYLPRIFRHSFVFWHIFQIAFWCTFFFLEHVKSPLKISDITTFLLLTSQCRCTITLWDQSGRSIEMRCVVKPITRRDTITTMSLIGSPPSVALVSNGRWSWSCRAFRRHNICKIHTKQYHPLKIVSPIWFWSSKEIR